MSDLRRSLGQYVQEQTPHAAPPFEGVDVRARRRSHRRQAAIAAIAAVPVIVAATLIGTQLARDPDPGVLIAQTPSVGPSAQQPVVPGSSPGPISPDSSASCVEQYNLTTLTNRDFAFDGTVARIAATQMAGNASGDASGALPGYVSVTFNVHEWFRGGDQGSVTVDMMSPSSAGTVSSVEGPNYRVGTRLLVSGEPRFGGSPLQDPIAWGCGFSRSADRATAAAWHQTFGKK